MLCFGPSFWKGRTIASFLVCWVGWRRMDNAALNLKSAAQRFGWWCGHGIGPHFVVLVLQFLAGSAPILPRRLQFWQKFWMLLVQMHLLCLCMESACSGRGFCKLSGKWVPCQARGVPHIWFSAAEALLTAHCCCICVLEPGPVLKDGFHNKPFDARRDLGLDGVSSRIAKGYCYERPLHARPRPCGGEYCWGMAISCVRPERDWPQRRWREPFAKVFHCGCFVCIIWTYSSLLCCLEEGDGWVSVPRLAGSHKIQLISSSSGKLCVWSSHSQYDPCWYVVVPDRFLEKFKERTSIVPHWFHVAHFAEFMAQCDWKWPSQCLWRFLFQLPTILFIHKQRPIMGMARLVSWLVSPTAFSRSLSKDLLCPLWSIGDNRYWQITRNFPCRRWSVFVWNTGVGSSQ